MDLQLTIEDGDQIVFVADATTRHGETTIQAGTTARFVYWVSQDPQPNIFQAYFPILNAEHQFYVPVDKKLSDFVKANSQHAQEAYRVLAEYESLATRYDANLRELNLMRDARDQAVASHAQDMVTLSEALNQEAQNRGWCHEYQQFVNRVNEDLNIELDLPTRDYEVCTIYTVRVYQRVNAENEDAASEDEIIVSEDDVVSGLRGRGFHNVSVDVEDTRVDLAD